jgi:hypothetical protein
MNKRDSRVLMRAIVCMLVGTVGTTKLTWAGPVAARLAVEKKRVVVGTAPTLLFAQISSPAFAALGFAQVAEYATRAIYEGPAAGVDAVRASLEQAGYRSSVATDLDMVQFHGYEIDADTGQITPAVSNASTPAGPAALYFLVLRSYPLDKWLDDLDRRSVVRLTALPPAAYVIRCDVSAVASLRQAPYVRGVYPLPPAVKLVGFPSATPAATPYAPMVISAAIASPAESLHTFLQSVAQHGHVGEIATGSVTHYQALLTDIDAQTLSQFDLVYEIVVDNAARPSSERQGLLVSAPSGQQQVLPSANTDYNWFLQQHNIVSSANTFSNTVVGIMDTGFDNYFFDHPDPPPPYSLVHPDFRFMSGTQPIVTIINPVHASGFSNFGDRNYHGTMVASIITGYPGPLPTRVDSGGYRLGLGVAPTVRCVPDKIFDCSSGPSNGLFVDTELIALAGAGVNVANLSFNDFGGPDTSSTPGRGCGYGLKSRQVDQQTRDSKILSIVSAGNSPEGCADNYVRTPATAKNGISVGSTDNFTLAYRDGGTSEICGWDTLAGQQDATHIPSYSARGYGLSTTTVVKPDLVAPSTRVTGPVSIGATGCIPASTWCSYGGDPPTAGFASYTDDTYNPVGGVPQPYYYGLWDGTSFAAPVVSGAAAVVRRWYRNLLGGDPSPAMTKAMLINGARDISGTSIVRDQNHQPVPGKTVGHIPDAFQGWGMVNFDRLLGNLGAYYFFDQRSALQSSPAGVWQKYLYIVNGQRETRVTLVWTDPAGSVAEAPANGGEVPPGAAINNLDLTLANALGTTWYGNQFAAGYSIANPPQPQPDAVNNVEEIIIPAGTFQSGAAVLVAVTATNAMSPQDFAVFADNAAEPGTTLTTIGPCRVVDTRGAQAPALAARSTRTFPVWSNCNIPTSAKAVVINATITDTGGNGVLRLFPGGIASPQAGVVYYSAGQTRADNAIVELGGTGTLGVYADQDPGSTTQLIIDVVGYYQ